MSDVTIDFEDLAVGTVVTDQYSAKGITFVAPAGTGVLPRVNSIAGGTKALYIRSGVEVDFCRLEAHFSVPRRVVRTTLTNVGSTPAQVTFTALDVAGNELASTSTVIPDTGTTSAVMELVQSLPHIYRIIVSTLNTHARFVVEEISFEEVTVAPGPDFGLRLELASPMGLTLLPGGSTDVAVSVVRVNGSAGEVAFSVEGLPNGVSATFLPASTSGNSATLQLTATNGATPAFDKIRVVGSPKSSAVGPEPRRAEVVLSVVPHFKLADSNVDVPPCTLVAASVEVSVPTVLGLSHTWSGTVSLRLLDPSTLPAGLTATFVPDKVTLSPQQPSVKARLEIRNETHKTDPVSIVVVGECPPYAASVATCKLRPIAGELSGFMPNKGNGPIALQPGTEVVLDGTGFCRGAGGTSVEFGNVKAVAPVVEIAADGRLARVRVPRLATTGKLTRVTPDGRLTSGLQFAVTTWRNTHGFSFDNPPLVGGVNYGELTDAFGKDQTWVTISFDPCDGIPFVGWFLDCEVQVSLFPHPLGLVVLAMAQGLDGHCFGMSLTSVRMFKGVRSYGSFPPSGATRAWELTGPTGPSAQLKREVFLTSLQQFGSEMLHHWIGASADVLGGPVSQASRARDEVRGLLAAGERPLISMRNGGKGHVVVALDVEDVNAGGIAYYIDIYDPNVPFLAAENTDATLHEDRELRLSRITVYSDGRWTYPGLSGDWGGYAQHTVEDGFVVLPYRVTPERPSFPADPMGLATLVLGGATTTSLEGGSGRRLIDAEGKLEGDPAKRLHAAPMAVASGRTVPAHGFVIADETAFVQTIRGVDSGKVDCAILGKDLSATIDALPLTPQSEDRIEHDAHERRFGFTTRDASKPLAAKLVVRANDGSHRTVGIGTTAFATGKETIRYDLAQDAVIYEHGGPATRCKLELGWMGTDGLPSSFSGELDVGERATLVIRPAKWRALDREPVTVESTRPDGSRTKTELRTRPPEITPIVTLRAKDDGREFEIEIEVRLPDGEPWTNLVLAWAVLDKKKVIQRDARTFAQVSAGTVVHTTRFSTQHPGTYDLVVHARGFAAKVPMVVASTEAKLELQRLPPGQARRGRR